MIAHFFNIDTLIRVENSVWIIENTKPNQPIIRISKSEFNLIKSGIYKKYNSPLNIAGTTYWLPENLFNTLKVKAIKLKFNIGELAFSLQEFMNPEVIEELEYDVLLDSFRHLKNKSDDIYVICSKKAREDYKPVIKKLEDELLKLGLKPTGYYYLSETFYNRDKDEITIKKVKLVLQHTIGLKTDIDKFTDEEITKYDRVYFYDDEPSAIKLVLNSNSILKDLLEKTEDSLKSRIKDLVKGGWNEIVVCEITHNKINPIVRKEVVLEINHITKTFEGFISKLK